MTVPFVDGTIRVPFESIADPLFAVGIVFPRASIGTAQMRPPHAPIHQMKHLHLIRRTDLRPIHPWHDLPPVRYTDPVVASLANKPCFVISVDGTCEVGRMAPLL